jgi:hypothetical protein
MNASKRAVLKIAAVRDDIALQTVAGGFSFSVPPF